MMPDFDEGLQSLKRDPLTPEVMEFDWQQLFELLNEDATSGQNDPRLSRVVVGLLRLLLPTFNRRLQPESLGLRLIALAWVLSPGYFEGTPSISKLAKRCGIRRASLANYTGYYSRLLQWRNRGQQHAWNWLRQGTPTHRGKPSRKKLKRNVPALVERKGKALTGDPKAAASSDEKTPQGTGGGVDPSTTRKRTRHE